MGYRTYGGDRMGPPPKPITEVGIIGDALRRQRGDDRRLPESSIAVRSFQDGAYGRGVTASESFTVPSQATSYVVFATVTATEADGDVGFASMSDGARPSHGTVVGSGVGETGCTLALPTRGGSTITFTYTTSAGSFGDVLFAAIPFNATV